jgi:hypothetical protein
LAAGDIRQQRYINNRKYAQHAAIIPRRLFQQIYSALENYLPLWLSDFFRVESLAE